MPHLTFTRTLPIREDVEVLVAGGGPAGLAAAITAARQGCKVLLVEAQSCLGGMGTAGMLPIFMAFGDSVNFYADGFGREVFTRLEKEGATLAERPWGAMLPVICVEGLKRLYDQMAEEAGVRVLLMTQMIAVEAEGSKVSCAICAAKSGIWAARAKIFIDATGDGDLAAWGGAPFEKGDERGRLMPATLCSLWADIDWQAVRASGLRPEEELIKALREDPHYLPHIDPHLPGIVPVGG
ncbi:MAG: FAD-dependent oxidoreductase, partial [Planctomycetota bacterium]|nr:FAD-dependent oxidoreductase [Planctomycetota bacterium]